jgi:hypothetical protein
VINGVDPVFLHNVGQRVVVRHVEPLSRPALGETWRQGLQVSDDDISVAVAAAERGRQLSPDLAARSRDENAATG